MKARIVLADDHTIVTEGLKALLEPEFQIVATVENGRAAVAAARHLKPDVIVLDVSMPLLNGIDAAREIRKVDSNIKIIFLTMHNDITYVQEAFAAGAAGYVVKHSAAFDLQLAIRHALLGRSYITPIVAKDVISALLDTSRQRRTSATRLTPRQRQVLQLVAEGHSTKEVAAILKVSPRTVEFHKYRLMQELSLRTTAQLTQYAVRHRIIAG